MVIPSSFVRINKIGFVSNSYTLVEHNFVLKENIRSNGEN